MNATITFYSFNLSNSAEAAMYDELKKEIRITGVKKFEHYTPINGRPKEKIFDTLKGVSEAIPIHLKLDNIFSNQWNEETYGRIFDWCEYTYENKKIVRGHFLDFEISVLDTRCVKKCGYCGEVKTKENSSEWFEDYHLNCGIRYLSEDNLFLTRASYIWKDKNDIHKSDIVPFEVCDNYRKRKVKYLETAYVDKVSDSIKYAEANYKNELLRIAIFNCVSEIILKIAKECHIFIKPSEIIVYSHTKVTPVEVNLRWMKSDPRLTDLEIATIKEFFTSYAEYQKEENTFIFVDDKNLPEFRITFNPRD